VTSRQPSRRAVLALPIAPLRRQAAAQSLDEGTFAAFAESVELALARAYRRVAELSGEGLLPLVDTHRLHHEEHAEAYAELAGGAATGRANPTLLEALAPGLDELSSQFEALTFARTLEDQVAATYAWAAARLERAEAAGVVCSILAVEATHATTLRSLLEEALDASFPGGAFEPADVAVGFAPEAFPLP